jgi:ABC-2 type transport system ATP-binding protein
MGMRQRLLLAQALMGKPDVLILDEPANGLDPAEVHRLRERLIDLAAAGVAILISSHILAEIELLATHVVVMNEGMEVTSGPLKDLLGNGAYEFEVDDLVRAKAVLCPIDGVIGVDCRGNQLLVTAPELTTKELVNALVMAGVGVDAVRSARSLEDVYLKLVGEEVDASR